MNKQIMYLFLLMFLVSCSGTPQKFPSGLSTGTVQDIDGNVYKTVKIGNQIWMAENLKVTHYRNGDVIPNLQDDDEWDNEKGAYCSYANDEANSAIYGLLYNWFAVNDERKIAPEGWHVPTDAEWQGLVEFLGGDNLAGGKMKSTGTIDGGDGLWRGLNRSATNVSGFTALPGGYRYNSGVFDGIGANAYFWSANESSGGTAWHRYLYYGNSQVSRYDYGWKQGGYSIRCIKN